MPGARARPRSGRIYDCAKRTVAGFPFRLEVHCKDATVELKSQTADQAAKAPLTARLGDILVVAQIYYSKTADRRVQGARRLLSQHGQPVMVVNWSIARSSIVGLPGIPQSADHRFRRSSDRPVAASVQTPVARAKQVELHGRIAEGSTPDHPVDRDRP